MAQVKKLRKYARDHCERDLKHAHTQTHTQTQTQTHKHRPNARRTNAYLSMLGSSKVQRKTARKEKNNLVETVLVQTVLVAFWNGASWKSPFSKTSTSACLDCSRRSQEDRSFRHHLEDQDARNRGRRRRSGMDWLRAGTTACNISH